jgi:hypothetical protein
MTSYTAPQGRLVLIADEPPPVPPPVMTEDVTESAGILYVPYVGDLVPIYNGSSMSMYEIQGGYLSLEMGLYQTSGHIYDIFAFLNSSGDLTLGTGSEAWYSNTERNYENESGTDPLTLTNGIWTNLDDITLYNDGTSYDVSSNQATYLGSVYMVTNGTSSMQFAPTSATGGTNNILGLYNAYNRVTFSSRSLDTNTYWDYTSTTWRPADGASSNINNRISWLDGLQQSTVRADYQVQAYTTSDSNVAYVAIGVDSTNTPTNGVTGDLCDAVATIRSALDITPLLGFHYAQALESATGTAYFYSANGGTAQGYTLQMKIVLEM